MELWPSVKLLCGDRQREGCNLESTGEEILALKEVERMELVPAVVCRTGDVLESSTQYLRTVSLMLLTMLSIAETTRNIFKYLPFETF